MKFGLKQVDIDAISNVFSKYPAINRVILYGSRAKGNFRPASDIDLVIEDTDLTFSELSKIESELDDLLLPYKIDLSQKRKITNPDILSHIERVGLSFF